MPNNQGPRENAKQAKMGNLSLVSSIFACFAFSLGPWLLRRMNKTDPPSKIAKDERSRRVVLQHSPASTAEHRLCLGQQDKASMGRVELLIPAVMTAHECVPVTSKHLPQRLIFRVLSQK